MAAFSLIHALQNAPSAAHPRKSKASRDPGAPQPGHSLATSRPLTPHTALFDRSILAGTPSMAVSQATAHLPAMHLDLNGSCFTPKMDWL